MAKLPWVAKLFKAERESRGGENIPVSTPVIPGMRCVRDIAAFVVIIPRPTTNNDAAVYSSIGNSASEVSNDTGLFPRSPVLYPT